MQNDGNKHNTVPNPVEHESMGGVSNASTVKYSNGSKVKISALHEISHAEPFKAVFPCALITALLYSVCFSGVEVFPQISFTLFCLSMCAVMLITFARLKINVDRKALVWLVPIVLLALCNGVFDLNIFSYGNVVFAHVLFSVFALRVLHPNEPVWDIKYIFNACTALFGDWVIAFSIISELLSSRKSGKLVNRAGKILIGTVIATPLLLLIFVLMLSGDPVFKSIFAKFSYSISDLDTDVILFVFTFASVFIYAVGYIPNAAKWREAFSPDNSNGMRMDTITGATVLILLNCLFLCFTIVQFAFLFSGGLMKLPDGLVYAEYARQGFFQLLFITVINFSVLIFFTGCLRGVKENKLLKMLLIILCAFTAVLIISSFYRMYLYMSAYGSTPLRMCVITFLIMESILIIITLTYFLKSGVNLLKGYIITCLSFYIIVNLTGSNYFSTYINIQRFYRKYDAVIDLSVAKRDGQRLISAIYEAPEFISGEYVKSGNLIVRKEYVSDEGRISGSGEDFSIIRTSNSVHWQNISLLKQKWQPDIGNG